MRSWFGLPALSLLLAGIGCDSSTATTCTSNDDCLQGGVSGVCRPSPRSGDSFCAYPDPECPAPPAERWGVLAGDGLAKSCVDVEQADNDGGLDSGVDGGPPAEFVFSIGGTGAESIADLAVSSGHTLTIVGTFLGETDLGGGVVASSGLEDAFIARFDEAHQHVWSNRYGGTNADFATSVASAPNGDVIMAGRVSGPVIDFGGGPVNVPSRAPFVARYSASGEYVWSKVFEANGSLLHGEGQRMTVNANGDVFMVGEFTGTAKFGGMTFTSAIFPDVFLVKLDGASGDVQWARQFGGDSKDFGLTISTSGGQVAIGGTFTGPATFGADTFTPSGKTDGFVAVFDGSSGAHVWSRQLGGVEATVVFGGVEFDSDGSLYAGGAFLGKMDAGGGPFSSAGDYDGFVVRYNSSGGHAWSRRVGGLDADTVQALAIDDSGLTVVGSFKQMADIGGTQLESLGESDVFILRLSKANTPKGVHRFGGASVDSCSTVSVGTQTHVAGRFRGTATLDGGTLSVTSKSGEDTIFVLGLNLP